ncbi:unnamed protein product [Gordionus sp. m RMFG-2023]
MVRNRIRSFKRIVSYQSIKEAAIYKRDNNTSVNSAANKFQVSKTTLKRYLSKWTQQREAGIDDFPECNYASKKIFNDKQESVLRDHILKCSELQSALSAKQIRILAYEITQKFSLKCPDSWVNNKMAGEDWFFGFKKRNPEIATLTLPKKYREWKEQERTKEKKERKETNMWIFTANFYV